MTMSRPQSAVRALARVPSPAWPENDATRRLRFSERARSTFRAGIVARRRLAAGAEVYHQGEVAPEFYVLNSGWMCLYRLLADGRRHNLKFAIPGDIIGFSLTGGQPMDHSAVSLCEATICVLDREAALRQYPQDAELMTELGLWIAKEHVLALQQLTSVTRATAIERVAHLMLELFVRVRRRLPLADDTLRVPLTQEQIGDAIGLSAVHVNRMLAELRQEQVLTLSGGLLTVLHPDRLVDMAAVDVAALLDTLSPSMPSPPIWLNAN